MLLNPLFNGDQESNHTQEKSMYHKNIDTAGKNINTCEGTYSKSKLENETKEKVYNNYLKSLR